MRELEITLTGLSEKDLRSRRERRRWRAAGLLVILACVLILAVRPARLQPESRDFGEQEVGSSSAVATFTLVNSSAVLSASEVAIDGDATVDFTVEGDCTEVAANAPCELAVRFTPITSERRSARLVVLDKRGGALVSSELIGTGVPPSPRIVKFDPPQLDFGELELGQRWLTATVRVINGGPKAFQVAVDGLSTDRSPAFAVLDEACTSKVLEVGAACTANVAFDPTTVGPHAATFSVSDDLVVAHTLEIAGSAIRRQPPPPPRKPLPAPRGDAIDFSPNPVTLTAQRNGTIGLPQAITLKNVSNCKFEATYGASNDSSATHFILGRLCEGFFFLPGSTCREEVRYRPQTDGDHQGEISIRNEAGNVIGTLKLEGISEAAP
jgi:hypothetical protein